LTGLLRCARNDGGCHREAFDWLRQAKARRSTMGLSSRAQRGDPVDLKGILDKGGWIAASAAPVV